MLIEIELEDGRTFLFKHPTRQVYFRYLDAVTESFSAATYGLLLDCAHEPDRDALARLFEDEPALVGVLGGELLKHMGGVAVKNSRKRERA